MNLIFGYLGFLYALVLIGVNPLLVLGLLVFSILAHICGKQPQCPNGDFCVFNGGDVCVNCGKQRAKKRVKKD